MLKLHLLPAVSFRLVFDDFPSAFIPALWAEESIAILEENMVLGNLVHRDFEDLIASQGDTINTRKPGEFKAKRKSASDTVTVQANTATNVAVKLDQHIHTSFIIKDADQSKSFKDLVVEYLHPAMLSIARQIDLTLAGQVHQFHKNSGGQLGLLSGSNADLYMLDARLTLNQNKAFESGRNLVLGSNSETYLLKDAKFTDANRVGDDGTALREASLGRKFGFDIFLAQNQPEIPAGTPVVSGAINNAAGYLAGVSTVTVDGFTAAIPVGTWFTIVGEGTPLRVVSTVGGATPTSITFHRPLKYPVVDNAVVTTYISGAVVNGAQVAGYDKQIAITTTTQPFVGQAVVFGASSTNAVYTIIDVDVTLGITLDRALEANISNGDVLNLSPAGFYNFAFHRNALALVTRPLALPMEGTGARAGRANYNGVSMRAVMTYDGNKQGTLVTLDTLLGVKVLDLNLGP
jgi:hypothetical protein